ncbi:MAG: poly-gamma-glutamate biosynthesis protein PgsC/CapC [Corynebacterium sp.]|nr:poly-gamma-glutamate biosynthesis protein PgsC/CapC [Corynebacterium sp.]
MAVIATTTLILTAIYLPYQRRVPIFGKDRFIVLCMLSFTIFSLSEYLLASLADVQIGGVHNILFSVLPVLMVNDIVRFGLRNTASGMALSAVGCATLAVPFMSLT